MQRFVISCLVGFLLLGLQNCKDGKKFHDEAPEANKIAFSKGEADILEFQRTMNAEFKDPETSPLPDRYRKDFEGLSFFDPDTSYQIVAKFVRTPEALPFLMPTNTERESEEVVFGVAYFELNGRKFQLEVYQTIELIDEIGFEDYLFLPFTDATNGKETYSGGRYIDLSIPAGDTLLIDFNRAYNPYCAYNKKYSCPLVPKGNNLEMEVRAGVKAFK